MDSTGVPVTIDTLDDALNRMAEEVRRSTREVISKYEGQKVTEEIRQEVQQGVERVLDKYHKAHWKIGNIAVTLDQDNECRVRSEWTISI